MGKNLVLTPRFSPDGKNIVFLQYKNNKASVYLMSLKSKKTKNFRRLFWNEFCSKIFSKGKKIYFL